MGGRKLGVVVGEVFDETGAGAIGHQMSLHLSCSFKSSRTLTPALISGDQLLLHQIENRGDAASVSLQVGKEHWVAYGEVNSQKHLCIQCIYYTYRLNMSSEYVPYDH